MRRFTLIALCVSGLLTAPAFALSMVINVPGDYSTIQSAIENAVVDDTLLIAAGVYTEPILDTPELPSMLFIDKSLTMIGEGSVILDALHGGRILYVAQLDSGHLMVHLINLTFRNGRSIGDGGGLCIENASVTVEDSFFESNEAWGNGGAVAGLRGSLYATGCRFEGNVAENGGALHFEISAAQVRMSACSFRDNYASPGAGGSLHLVRGARADLTDCVILDSYSSEGGWATIDGSQGFSSDLLAEGCSFIGRQYSSTDGGFHFIGYDAGMLLDHCLVTGAGGAAATSTSYPRLTLTECNNIWGNGGGNYVNCFDVWEGQNGNFSSNPLFCDPDEGNFHISSISPCAPDLNECQVLVGALGVNCSPTSNRATSLSAVKSLY